MEESKRATDEGEIQRRIEARKAEIREWHAKRRAAGLYFPSEVATALSGQMGFNQRWAQNFLEGWKSEARVVKGLLSAAKEGKVAVFDPATWLPVEITTEAAALALFVTRDGVNKWLEETGAAYRWEQADSSTEPRSSKSNRTGTDRAALMKRHQELIGKTNKHTAILASEFGISESRVRKIVREEKNRNRPSDTLRILTHRIS